ncbi:unnamed protein product [Strongylus vulgaris]|uniref:Uncharacterized protein n=1 Tax=Strongylus vulgaris TaxID=40348 RepID=A0A3P7IU37_STRVU|nr:unnamed protein product [Strongylus vulgaris]
MFQKGREEIEEKQAIQCLRMLTDAVERNPQNSVFGPLPSELELMTIIVYDFLGENSTKAGLWAYGYTKYPESPNLDRMFADYEELLQEIRALRFYDKDKPLSTSDAIKIINSLKFEENQANCLVLFAAPQDTKPLPILDPYSNIKRIVVVGFNDTELQYAAGERGVAVSVPYHYVDDDIFNVLDAINGR